MVVPEPFSRYANLQFSKDIKHYSVQNLVLEFYSTFTYLMMAMPLSKNLVILTLGSYLKTALVFTKL